MISMWSKNTNNSLFTAHVEEAWQQSTGGGGGWGSAAKASTTSSVLWLLYSRLWLINDVHYTTQGNE